MPEAGLPPLTTPTAVYVWPYGDMEFVQQTLPDRALIWAGAGPLARGDLEPAAYSLYTRYQVTERPDWQVRAEFGELFHLYDSTVTQKADDVVRVDLIWGVETAVDEAYTVFVHVVGSEGLIGQSDTPPADGLWPYHWWRTGLLLHERHTITLTEPYDPTQHQILVGWYDDATHTRLSVTDETNAIVGNTWVLGYED